MSSSGYRRRRCGGRPETRRVPWHGLYVTGQLADLCAELRSPGFCFLVPVHIYGYQGTRNGEPLLTLVFLSERLAFESLQLIGPLEKPYTVHVGWEVEVSDEFKDWYRDLPGEEQNVVIAAIEVLENEGPSLGRPLVDRVHSSRHHTMKELRPMKDAIRILFTFDPRRVVILLVAGSKKGRWNAWYRAMIPIADDMYDEHIETLRMEGLL